MDKRLIAKAIQTRRKENPPHATIIDCEGKTESEIKRIQNETQKAHTLQEMIIILIHTSDE